MSDEQPEPFGAEYLAGIRASRLEIAKSAYSQIFDKLWITNGAGAAAVFARSGDSIKNGHSSSHIYLLPLAFFVLGAIAPIMGNAFALMTETRRIYAMESASFLLDLPAGHAKRPTEQAGLTLWDARTIFAILSTLALIIGGGSGFYLLARS